MTEDLSKDYQSEYMCVKKVGGGQWCNVKLSKHFWAISLYDKCKPHASVENSLKRKLMMCFDNISNPTVADMFCSRAKLSLGEPISEQRDTATH